ncbi:hypothetical protein HGRIS_010574 [Hohenbuehelia grisea]|uniref:DUF6593 domain-containing protein n=1 Tax=Hohenbuehelia grisea TaxID=104357 RepID=A0ABR3IX45_9AGAR
MNSSQITLVDDESPRDGSSTLLYFTPDSMKNSTISLGGPGGKPLYIIKSDRSATRTNVQRAEESTAFATVERRGVLPDRLTLSGAEPIKINQWFRYSGIFNV